MPVRVKCSACNGTGSRTISKIYQDTYNLVKKKPGLRSVEYAFLAAVGNEVMCNRLRQLSDKGLLKSKGRLMDRVWRVS